MPCLERTVPLIVGLGVLLFAALAPGWQVSR